MQVSQNKLMTICRLIGENKEGEARKLIPPRSRHLLLMMDNPDGIRWYGHLPLLNFAAMKGCRTIIEYLLDGGADIKWTNPQNGLTSLHLAAYYGHEQCCKLLLDRGANIEERDYGGSTSLKHASTNGMVNVCKLLLKKGANIDARHTDSWTALHCAAFNDDVSLTKLLLSEGARIDLVSSSIGQTPLGVAKKSGSTNVVSLIENHIVMINLSGVISRGLIKTSTFSDFLIHKVDDPRLFIIIANFAYQ